MAYFFKNPKSVKNDQIVLKFGMGITKPKYKILVIFLNKKGGVLGVLIGPFFEKS